MFDLDRYAPANFRALLERDFYTPINGSGRLEQLLHDQTFLSSPENHVGLYSDHGVVHARDVARQVVTVLENVNGVLIPRRDAECLSGFMSSYGVLLAYLHDIGMKDCTLMGRDMHPEFAGQFVFQRSFDPLLEEIWQANPGNVAGRLSELAGAGDLTTAPRAVLREMLALSCAHSKSKVPVALLNDPVALRAKMMHVVGAGMNRLWAEQRLQRCERRLASGDSEAAGELAEAVASLGQVNESTRPRENMARCYDDPEHEPFAWLVSERPATRALVDDVIDTLRCLRCADALRQRGTVLKSSGSYEIFVDQMTASAVCALRLGDAQLFMVELSSALTAGEANLSASELGSDGNLRIVFHHGAFASAEIVERAASVAAIVVDDIQADVIGSFERPHAVEGLKPHDEILILIEAPQDNPAFAQQVAADLLRHDPSLESQVRVVPLSEGAGDPRDVEGERYLGAEAFVWDTSARGAVLACLGQSGHNVAAMDADRAFEQVRLTRIRAGETLIEAGTSAAFVYVPMAEGLRVIPLGGYQAFDVAAWMPLGSTGVIRGAIRNATVTGDRDVDVLMIPRETYLTEWHRPISLTHLAARLSERTL